MSPVIAGAGLFWRPDTTKTTGPALVHAAGMAAGGGGGAELDPLLHAARIVPSTAAIATPVTAEFRRRTSRSSLVKGEGLVWSRQAGPGAEG
jgi:hypothetical protein